MDAAPAVRLHDDPRCQPGAFITFDRGLYEVVQVKGQVNAGIGGLGRHRQVLVLEAIDAMSPLDSPVRRWLGEQQIHLARLVRAAPTVQDTVPA